MGDSHFRLVIPTLRNHRAYADAQLDDYHGLPRSRFPDAPPARVSLRARASHPAPAGTLGFGFWNDPFSLSGGVLTAPNTVWFFYASPPSDMALVEGVPGRGWKAATLNAGRVPTMILAPAALAAIALTRLPGLGRPVMRTARRATRSDFRTRTTSPSPSGMTMNSICSPTWPYSAWTASSGCAPRLRRTARSALCCGLTTSTPSPRAKAGSGLGYAR